MLDCVNMLHFKATIDRSPKQVVAESDRMRKPALKHVVLRLSRCRSLPVSFDCILSPRQDEQVLYQLLTSRSDSSSCRSEPLCGGCPLMIPILELPPGFNFPHKLIEAARSRLTTQAVGRV